MKENGLWLNKGDNYIPDQPSTVVIEKIENGEAALTMDDELL